MGSDLPEHDHCRYCGDPVPFDQAYCCEECYYKDQKRRRKAKLMDAAVAAIAVGGAMIILVLGYLF